MKIVNLYEAKTRLSDLASAAVAGEDVVIARNGKPLVRLVPVERKKPSDAFGRDAGPVRIALDFDETPPEFADYADPSDSSSTRTFSCCSRRHLNGFLNAFETRSMTRTSGIFPQRRRGRSR